jgi:hypothetical protein
MEIYIKFVRNLITKSDILNKRFFLVIRYRGSVAKKSKSLLGGLVGGSSKSSKKVNLKKAKDYLYPKRNFLLKQLKKMGLKAVQLNNDQLIQLYYEIYDPDRVGIKKAELSESDYTTGMVGQRKGKLVDDLMTGAESGSGSGSEKEEKE